jgi:hypothetical protein
VVQRAEAPAPPADDDAVLVAVGAGCGEPAVAEGDDVPRGPLSGAEGAEEVEGVEEPDVAEAAEEPGETEEADELPLPQAAAARASRTTEAAATGTERRRCAVAGGGFEGVRMLSTLSGMDVDLSYLAGPLCRIPAG